MSCPNLVTQYVVLMREFLKGKSSSDFDESDYVVRLDELWYQMNFSQKLQVEQELRNADR